MKKTANDYLFVEREPYNEGFLKVSDIHSIYFEESGNAKGIPVVFLHGGPGGCSDPKHRRYFNPEKYRIILFDQRGCGKSEPFGELRENTTRDIIEDVEKLRKHLDVQSWMVFGRSWGSTLALIYAIKHTKRVSRLIIGGVFTFSQEERDWLFKGAAYIFPDYFENMTKMREKHEKNDISRALCDRILSEDPKKQKEAVNAFAPYNARITTLEECERDPDVDYAHLLGGFRIYFHYEKNAGFLDEGWIIQHLSVISEVPTVIIQGRYDMCTPFKTAWEVHKKLPASQLITVPLAGHRTSEPDITKAIVDIVNTLAKNSLHHV